MKLHAKQKCLDETSELISSQLIPRTQNIEKLWGAAHIFGTRPSSIDWYQIHDNTKFSFPKSPKFARFLKKVAVKGINRKKNP